MESKKTTNILLIFIVIGIWVLVVQSFLITPVKVIGGDIDVSGSVNVSGSVDVDNTVSISIDEVLGQDGTKYYYNNR